MVSCLEQSTNDAYGLADATATPSSLLQKIQNGLSFWYRPTQVVLERRPLNDYMLIIFYLYATPLQPCRYLFQ